MYKLFFLFIIVLFIVLIYLIHNKSSERFESNNPYLTRKHKRDLCKYDIDNENNYNKLLSDIQNNKIEYGDLICCHPDSLDKIYDILDKLKVKINIRLIDHSINGLDKSFNNYNNILDHTNVINIYSENWMDKNDNPKIKIEPIGISYKDIYTHNLDNELESIAKSMPNNSYKPLKVLCNSHKKQYLNPASGYRNDRSIMIKYLKDKTDIIDFCNDKHDFSNESLTRAWKKHKDYAFELSPSGNGLDCHRTYEALILKTIPIVRTNTLDPIYLEHDLPVVIVKEWNEVTKVNLEKWHEKYKDYFTKELDDKMRINYWTNQLNNQFNNTTSIT